jgi:hypothetical protein
LAKLSVILNLNILRLFRQSSRILRVSVTFADLLHMFLSALPIPPPWHARGLDLANLRVAKPVGPYLLLPHVTNPPIDMLGGLAQSQPRGRST